MRESVKLKLVWNVKLWAAIPCIVQILVLVTVVRIRSNRSRSRWHLFTSKGREGGCCATQLAVVAGRASPIERTWGTSLQDTSSQKSS